jgi:hypothetical protein
MKSDKYFVECGISGVGEHFEGSFDEALQFARRFVRHPSWYVTIWNSRNERIARVTKHTNLWVRKDYRL